MAKSKYFDIKNTLKQAPDCKYYVIFGERSNGKSYSTLSYFIEDFFKSGFKKAFAYLRRWREDIKIANLNEVFKSIESNDNGINNIELITKGQYNHVHLNQYKYYLSKIDDNGEIIDIVNEPMGYIFCLSESERKKSTGYPSVHHILLEEFISEGLPMLNEFIHFKSIISTIVRNDDKADIFLLGNTINKYNVYFTEFGLKNAKNQKKNTIDIYQYQSDDGRILNLACEYADFPDRKNTKKSNIYWAFNNKDNAMIINGEWQIKAYPHLEYYYVHKDIKLIYFIKFDNEIFQCEIIKVNDNKETRIINDTDTIYSNKNVLFTYIHEKTTPIKYPHKHYIYQEKADSHHNYKIGIGCSNDELDRFIASFFYDNKVFYQDNNVGNAIESYLNLYK